MNSCNFINRVNSHTPEVEVHTRPKLCHFGVVRAKLFGFGHRAGVFIWENFRLARSLSQKPRSRPGDLGNRASPASHMNTSIFFTKKRVARRDLGNRASPVDRAHMKRP